MPATGDRPSKTADLIGCVRLSNVVTTSLTMCRVGRGLKVLGNEKTHTSRIVRGASFWSLIMCDDKCLTNWREVTNFGDQDSLM